MKSPHNSDSIKINGKIKPGKYILSRLRFSNIPVSQSSGTELILPKTNNNKWVKYFCYFSVDDQIQINYYIEALLDLALGRYMLKGNKLHIPNKHLLERYIYLTKQANSPSIFDQLLKSDYRSRKYSDEILTFDLQSIDL